MRWPGGVVDLLGDSAGDRRVGVQREVLAVSLKADWERGDAGCIAAGANRRPAYECLLRSPRLGLLLPFLWISRLPFQKEQ